MANVICFVYKRNVQHNQRGVLCSVCNRWLHASCAHVDGAKLIETNVTTEPWFCTNCISAMFPLNNLEDDTDFINIATGSIQFSKCLKPSTDLYFKSVYDEEGRQLMNSTNPDPDANYFNSIQLPQSRYVTSYDLNTLLQKISYRNKLSLYHANCRSVAKKINNLLCTIIHLNLVYL